MGDRYDGVGMTDDAFDNRWGAGRPRTRMWSSPGADAPSKFQTGHVCVDNGTYVALYPNGLTTLSSDVDKFRAVAWWYDPDRQNGLGWGFDKVDLHLDTAQWVTNPLPSLNWTFDTVVSNTDDSRQRVTYTAPANKVLRLRIEGRDVTTDNIGCGSDSMKVYYAFYFEDSDRDDDANLSNWVRVD